MINILKATSKKIFAVSNSGTPNKKTKFKTKVMAKSLNVREWADPGSELCSFSPLPYGKVINVCDALLSPDKKTWYYIKVGDKYGFVNAGFVDQLDRDKVITLLSEYNKTIKKYYQLTENRYNSDLDTFPKAKRRWEYNKVVGLTCVVPLRWALHDMGVHRADGKSLIAAVRGSFANSYTGKVKNRLKRITKDGPIGNGTKSAIDKGLLQKGDIVCWKDATHTATYSGDGYFFYEGGGSCVKNGHYPNGIKLNYGENFYRNKKISEVLRWKA